MCVLIKVSSASACVCVCVCDWCRVSAWRRRLQCAVCELSGCGACIRCEMPSCTNAFHATCAQTAGVYMRLEPVFSGANGSRFVPARRSLYCNLHRPVETATNRAGVEFTYKLNGCLKLSKKSPASQRHAQDMANMRSFTMSLHIPTNKYVLSLLF